MTARFAGHLRWNSLREVTAGPTRAIPYTDSIEILNSCQRCSEESRETENGLSVAT